MLLDVVYNHTCEGNHLGPTLSLRGLDNVSYYHLLPDNPEYYLDFTGTGNSLRAPHPQSLTLILDSLRYWVSEMHVDGFRFDLAVTIGRDEYDFRQWSGVLDAIHQDPVLAGVKLIAEPWDIGEGGYQLGISRFVGRSGTIAIGTMCAGSGWPKAEQSQTWVTA